MVDRYCVFGHRCVVFQTSEPERTPVLSLLFAFFFFFARSNERSIKAERGRNYGASRLKRKCSDPLGSLAVRQVTRDARPG